MTGRGVPAGKGGGTRPAAKPAVSGRVFPAGTGGNPSTAQLGSAVDLSGTTAKPAIRQNPEVVQKTVIPFTDSGVPGFVDGAGNRIWHVDSSASAQAIIFTSAAESTDFSYVVKWVKGSNPLTMSAASGKVNGTTTYTGVTVGDAYEFRSDGTDYQLVARVGDFAVSGGPAAFSNLTITGSATFSGTVLFSTAASISGSLSVGTLVVSGTASFSGTVVMNAVQVLGTASFSATVVMNSLTVLGSASFSSDVYVRGSLTVSATLSVVTAITLAGSPLTSDFVKLGSVSIATGATNVRFSGSWSDYQILELKMILKGSAGGPIPSSSFASYTDGGTSPILNIQSSSISSGAFQYLEAEFGNGTAFKWIRFLTNPGATVVTDKTATANAGILNALQFATGTNASATISSGVALLYGKR